MFTIMERVHFRTLPSAQDAQEDTMREALDQLEVAAGGVDQSSFSDPVGVMSEARDAARAIRRTWNILPRTSPYRDVLSEAGRLIARISEVGWDISPTLARDLEDERAVLLLLDARLPLMRAVRTALNRMAVREFARSTGLSVGRVSDLSNGRGGLPGPRTARALEGVAGAGLEEVVARARADAASIRREARRREREHARADRVPPEGADVLMRVNLALGVDAELLTLVQRIVALPKEARRALSTLLSLSLS
jgi:hypothetical protein